MSRLTGKSKRFLVEYQHKYGETAGVARAAGAFVARSLEGADFPIHAVSARPKSIDSVIAKLRDKRYKNPNYQLTDAIGVRVITFYQDDVDKVVALLSKRLRVDKNRSVDKRRSLGLQGFGYRSVHLIARLPPDLERSPEYAALSGRWFEIQIRSLLEHTWAEIERSIVYKSGIAYPREVLRLFAALAGSIELLEREFRALRGARDWLIVGYRNAYIGGIGGHQPLDVARLIGYMESAFPGGLGWLRIQGRATPLPPNLAKSCLDSLKSVDVRTGAALGRIFAMRAFKGAVRSFASNKNLAPAEVSHLALIVIAVAVKNPKVLRQHFPEMIRDPSIETFIAERERRKGTRKTYRTAS